MRKRKEQVIKVMLKISENINNLRKENNMTQEQLAEALGVSVAAVSKWERGVTVPELKLIADMADMFCVSMDTLIGYEFRNNNKEAVVQRLKEYVHDREAKEVFTEIEKAIHRYPNCFEIIYYSAVNYKTRGLYLQNISYSQKALSLYHHALHLIYQNRNVEISENTIWNSIADIHITLGEYEKGIDILKKKNPCRLNHPLIGQTLAAHGKDYKSALPYLSTALLDLTVSQMNIVVGYVNLYEKNQDYQNAIQVLEWGLTFFQGLKKPETPSFLDKNEASLWAILAMMQLKLEKIEEAKESLRQAKTVARMFDANPSYDARNVRFVSPTESASSSDDLGVTAIDGIERIVSENANQQWMSIWKDIRDEK